MESMKINELMAYLQKKGFSLWIEGEKLRFKAPQDNITNEIMQLLKQNKAEIMQFLEKNSEENQIVIDRSNRYEAFPLTPVQTAYLMGRRDLFEYGGVACHVYLELKYDFLNVKKVESIWNQMVEKYDMLRAVVSEDGYQQVLKTVEKLEVPCWDLTAGSNTKEYESFRKEMGNRVYEIGKWPMFGIGVANKKDCSILHFSMEFLIADWTSIWMLLSEFESCYYGTGNVTPAPELTFRDYLAAEMKLRETPRYFSDKQYWKNRLEQLPEGPELPVLPMDSSQKEFFRKMLRLDCKQWESIKKTAQTYSITPTVVILTVYAEVIRRWSANKEFCINLTVLNRQPLHKDVPNIVGDFTTLNLLEIKENRDVKFIEQAKTINQQLFEDLDHSLYSGVDVIRDLSQNRNKRIFMPYVYTSAVGLADQGRKLKGQFDGGITQTPQVFIDCQVMDGDFGLQVNWDVRKGVFPDRMIDDMFTLFEKKIQELAMGNEVWEKSQIVPLPLWQKQERDNANETEKDLPIHLLYHNFREWAKKAPDRIAVYDGERTFTYGELDQYALNICNELIQHGMKEQECVAIGIGKGAYQLAAVFGILYAGGIYVPIAVDQAVERAKKIIEVTGCRFLLITSQDRKKEVKVDTIIEVDKLECKDVNIKLLEQSLDNVAYIIFTSGSTGTPKGVSITHRSAMNTIEDMNQRFEVNENDCVLGLSQLNFDLSVYDIFGLLGVGGKIVYPNSQQYMNTEDWLYLMKEHNITVWNSVPAFMKMLLTQLETNEDGKQVQLEKVFLSGDWIPVDMPKQICKYAKNAKIVCLGGATEAAIWSIYHCYEGAEYKTSIPYGKPLTNQQMDVLDRNHESCPVWVIGEIAIKGIGLAQEYYQDEILTKQKFIWGEKTGERIYLTGDMGRYLPGGEIEFIGRNDNQVKIRGHRIELGEIENVLKKHADINDAVALVDSGKHDIFAMVETAPVSLTIMEERERVHKNLRDMTEQIDQDFFLEFDWEKAEKAILTRNIASMYSLLCGFQKLGILEKGNPIKIEDFIYHEAILDKFRWLATTWINLLKEYGMIKQKDEEEIEALEYVNEEIAEEKWQEVYDNWYDKLGSTAILDYIRDNAKEFANILSGKVDPVGILYPDGSSRYAEALYIENTVTKYINKSICRIVTTVQERIKNRPIKILEVGAGTGATTQWVLKALGESNFEYCFTDISKYFFAAAKEKFGEKVTIQELNLNEDFKEQGIYPNTFDIVIGAYVLNNVKDVKETIEKLKDVIRPEGYLLFSETIHAEPWLLISQALMMTQAEDSLRDDSVFMDSETWLSILQEKGSTDSFILPKKESKATLLGANLFVSQFKNHKIDLNEKQLQGYLKKNLPAYMIPSELRVVEQLPLSVNGKIDRKAIAEWIKCKIENKQDENKEVQSDLELNLAKIWCEALEIDKLGKHENFYDHGADSLIMAQVTTKVRNNLHIEIPFDALLRHMLNTPTIEEVAAYISQYGKKEETEVQKEYTFESIDKTGERIEERGIIFIHGALGSTDIYKNIIPELEQKHYGEIMSIGIADFEKYCELDAEETIPYLTDLYANKILEEKYEKVQIIGYSFSGVIAIEIAKRLLEEGMEVEDLLIIDGGSMPVELLDELIYELFFIGNIHVPLEQLGFQDSSIFETVFERIIAEEKGSISLEDFKENSEGSQVYETVKSLVQLSQRERFERYISLSQDSSIKGCDVSVLERLYKIFKQSFAALHFVPEAYFGDIRYFKTKDRNGILKYFSVLLKDWEDICIGEFIIEEIEGNHYTCLDDGQNAKDLAEKIAKIYFV